MADQNSKKILVVDDDPVLLKITSMVLAGQGYDVITADDGSAALTKARQQRPDLILLDLIFPPDVAHGGSVSWDGFLIMSWLKRMEETARIPVVMMTMADPATYMDRALSAGVYSFIRKPAHSPALLKVIAEAIAESESRRVAPMSSGQKRVLFVDDEGDWRFIAATYLEDAGFEVLTAKDIAQALSRMEKVKLHVIILDVNLGGENGLLLLQFLKQNHPGVPIIIYTGLDHDDDAIKTMLAQGATQYLRKRTMSELCDAVKTAAN